MRSSLFWNVNAAKVGALFTDFSGQPVGLFFKGQPLNICSIFKGQPLNIGSIFKGQPLKLVQIGISETSVTNYQSMNRKIPEELSFQGTDVFACQSMHIG